MKKPYEIIKELESNNSRLFKESVILREMRMGNDIFFEGANFACDKLKTFGILFRTLANGSTNYFLGRVFTGRLYSLADFLGFSDGGSL